jgi:alpha-1,6-mannosyltransferase
VIVAPGPKTTDGTWHGSHLYRIGGPAAPASPGYHVLTGPGRLRRILERERPDVIELGSLYLAPWLLRFSARKLAIPVIGFFHLDLAGAVLRTLARGWPGPARAALQRGIAAYLRRAFGQCRCVVGASEAAMEAMAGAGLRERRLVPFGVDLETFRPAARDPAWKAEVGAAGRPVALFAGRLTVEKNLRVVLHALPELHRRYGLKLVLIGDGGWRRDLAAMAARTPEMLAVLPFETDRARLARAYASADVYVAPSPHETFGLAALEAAACGLPIVGAAAGALAARLAGASWARTVPAADPKAWCDAVGTLLTADGTVIRTAAHRSAATYGWDRTFGALLGIYREAIEISPPAHAPSRTRPPPAPPGSPG